MSFNLSSGMTPHTMSPHDPYAEAEWMLETIIDDFAESLDNRDRAQFYMRLAELIAERRDREERLMDDAESEPGESQQIH
jgi:hypothetical protein